MVTSLHRNLIDLFLYLDFNTAKLSTRLDKNRCPFKLDLLNTARLEQEVAIGLAYGKFFVSAFQSTTPAGKLTNARQKWYLIFTPTHRLFSLSTRHRSQNGHITTSPLH
jgi:hypothetical protein